MKKEDIVELLSEACFAELEKHIKTPKEIRLSMCSWEGLNKDRTATQLAFLTYFLFLSEGGMFKTYIDFYNSGNLTDYQARWLLDGILSIKFKLTEMSIENKLFYSSCMNAMDIIMPPNDRVNPEYHLYRHWMKNKNIYN